MTRANTSDEERDKAGGWAQALLADEWNELTYDQEGIANFWLRESHDVDDARRRDRCGWRLLKIMSCNGINT